MEIIREANNSNQINREMLSKCDTERGLKCLKKIKHSLIKYALNHTNT